MDRLETRELAYFIAVAEELHFGRAAERLGMAQPPLSRAIARLERRIGVALFERTSRRVELTAAGAVFLREGRRALDTMDTAVRRTRQAARPGPFTIAVRPGTGAGLLSELIHGYEGDPPEIVFTHDQPAALHEGTADIAVLCVGSDDLTDLRTIDLAEEMPVALVPAGHRLSQEVSVTSEELRQEQAFEPACPPQTLDEIFDSVPLGRLITVIGSSGIARPSATVAVVPVSDMPPTRLVLGWPSGTPAHPALAEFTRAARAWAPTSA
ncbi:LysR family transcriptional regulator [Saccharopolyspora gloriosae]|uniref:LysR family transcriptional regulator n=1 Tax=Saccharopolyspora gloriosae TaxID=455344 RepID=UPI001FB60FE7|nr:LysR family transcriptional regulator [Saccharopolyspora gloriosae]